MATERFKTQIQLFGQLVIGPPGSGKTTYCYKMNELLKELGRKVCKFLEEIFINLRVINTVELKLIFLF